MTPKRTLLLTDDDPVLSEMGSESLTAEGYRVLTANDGVAALERLSEEAVDLLVCDIDMPRMNGLETLMAVRASKDAWIASMPVIMLTGRNDEASIRDVYALGATSYVAKPVSWVNMVHQIGFVLRASDDARALREAHDAERALSRSKDALMVSLRHELRSPLHVIDGFAKLLADGLGDRLDDSTRDSLAMINDAVDGMATKLNSLFLYSEVLMGDFALHPEFTTAGRIATKAVNAVTGRATDHSVTIRIDTAERGTVELRVDEEKLVLALSQLIDNAVAHSPAGGEVIVHLSQQASGETVRFAVEDQGPGIDNERAEDLFEAFVQGDGGLTRSAEGLGLGLTVARSIAAHHHGSVTLSGRAEGGTRAILEVPNGLGAGQIAAA